MDPAIVAGIFGVGGVALGVLLQHCLGKAAQVERFQRKLRIDAYAAYLKAVGETEQLQAISDPTRRAEITAAAIMAKARICTFGTPAVVSALADFEGSTEQGLTPTKKSLLLKLIREMRHDAVGQTNIDLDNIERILFKSGVGP